MGTSEKKIAVLGIGGVGGYLAGMLASYYDSLIMVARGKRKESLEKQGLKLISDYSGDRWIKKVNIVEELRESPDYLFICVKDYSLDRVLEEIQAYVSEDTVIIPVMNGVTPAKKIKAYFPNHDLVAGVIYIVSFVKEDGSVWQQGSFVDLRIGGGERTLEVEELLKKAGVPVTSYKDIDREIWRKFILNSAYNVETAYYRQTIGQLRENPKKTEEYHALILEAYEIARANGIGITREDIEDIWSKFFKYQYEASSSLQRDLEAGKSKTEADLFSGYLAREADRLGIIAPVTKRMYQGFCKDGYIK